MEVPGNNDTVLLSLKADKSAALHISSTEHMTEDFSGKFELTPQKELVILKNKGDSETVQIITLNEEQLVFQSGMDTIHWQRVK